MGLNTSYRILKILLPQFRCTVGLNTSDRVLQMLLPQFTYATDLENSTRISTTKYLNTGDDFLMLILLAFKCTLQLDMNDGCHTSIFTRL
jgi:hypothetical protein